MFEMHGRRGFDFILLLCATTVFSCLALLSGCLWFVLAANPVWPGHALIFFGYTALMLGGLMLFRALEFSFDRLHPILYAIVTRFSPYLIGLWLTVFLGLHATLIFGDLRLWMTKALLAALATAGFLGTARFWAYMFSWTKTFREIRLKRESSVQSYLNKNKVPAASRLFRFIDKEYKQTRASAYHSPRDFMFPELTAKAWHDPQKFSWVKNLEKHWKQIRDEAAAVLHEDRLHTYSFGAYGTFNTYTFFRGGRPHEENCRRCPVTTKLIRTVPGAQMRESMFSIIYPGDSILPHVGTGNIFLTGHLGLQIPEKCQIRVSNDTREWQEGKVLIFDSSFDHEVWNHGNGIRIILLMDFWHPELTAHEQDFFAETYCDHIMVQDE